MPGAAIGGKGVVFLRADMGLAALGKPPLHAEDASFLAIVSDAVLDTDLPCLPLNNPAAVADFIVHAVVRGWAKGLHSTG